MVHKLNRITFMEHKPKFIVEIQFGFDLLQVEIVEAAKSCGTLLLLLLYILYFILDRNR
jgi:hypothetical protein